MDTAPQAKLSRAVLRCGLIHRLDFRVVDGKVEFRTRRDDRATSAARRNFKFAPDK